MMHDVWTSSGKRWYAEQWTGEEKKLDWLQSRIAGCDHFEVRGDGSIEYSSVNGSKSTYLLRKGDYLLWNNGYAFPVSADVATLFLFDQPKVDEGTDLDYDLTALGEPYLQGTVWVTEGNAIVAIDAPDGCPMPDQFVRMVSESIPEFCAFPDYYEELRERGQADRDHTADNRGAWERDEAKGMA